MRVLMSTRRLSNRGGSETYFLTVAAEMQRLGHEVTLHADEGDAELADLDGTRVSHGALGLPREVDVVLVQDSIVSYTQAERFPGTPQVFIAHSSVHDLQSPPQLPGVVGAVVVMNDRVQDRMQQLAQPPARLVRLTQPVSFDLFSHPTRLPTRPQRLLSLGNRLTDERRTMLAAACDENDIDFIEMGALAGNVADPTEAIKSVDIVVGYGRCIVEAMMAGRAAYVFDHQGGDGWITRERYPEAEADGFMGRAGEPVRDDELSDDLRHYDAAMGPLNRDLALRHHDAAEHTRRLVELAASLTPTAEPIDHAGEFARLTRLSWQWEASAIQRGQALEAADRELEHLRREASEHDDLTDELAATRARAEEATSRADELAAEVDRVHQDREAFESTGSFRAAQAISRMVRPRRRRQP